MLIKFDAHVCNLFICDISSCGQWDGVELPLCEAFRQRDGWGSPNTALDPSNPGTDDLERPVATETVSHHLNGHGSSTNEQS